MRRTARKSPAKKAAAKKAGPVTFRPTKEETTAAAKRLVKQSIKQQQEIERPVIKLKLPYHDLKATEAGLQKIVAAIEVLNLQPADIKPVLLSISKRI